MAPPHNNNDNQVEAWRSEMNNNVKEMRSSVQELLVEVRQRPTRPEIEAMLATKASTDIFNATIASIREDITDVRGDVLALKADMAKHPEEARNWLGTAAAAGGCLLTLISVVFAIVVGIIALIAPHWH